MKAAALGVGLLWLVACGNLTIKDVTNDTFRLSIRSTGDGVGTIGSSVDGCGAASCEIDVAGGTVMVLTAAPGTHSMFAGWTGGGCSENPCHLTINSDVTVAAGFVTETTTLAVERNGTGAGTVTSANLEINCGDQCAHAFETNTEVTLIAAPDDSSRFAGWSGLGCTGHGACVVKMSSARTITATFMAGSSNLEGLAFDAGASHIFTFASTEDVGDCGGFCPHLSTTAGAALVASAVPGTQGALALHDINDSGVIASVDDGWGRTADRTYEFVFKITAESSFQSLFMGPGTYASKTQFATVTTVTSGSTVDVQNSTWNHIATLDTNSNMLNKVVYLAIAYNHASGDQTITWKAQGSTEQSVTVHVGESDPSSGDFLFGGNGGSNIFSLSSTFYHFAVYNSQLNASDIDLRIAMLGI